MDSRAFKTLDLPSKFINCLRSFHVVFGFHVESRVAAQKHSCCGEGPRVEEQQHQEQQQDRSITQEEKRKTKHTSTTNKLRKNNNNNEQILTRCLYQFC
jgi:hypothetical protein